MQLHCHMMGENKVEDGSSFTYMPVYIYKLVITMTVINAVHCNILGEHLRNHFTVRSTAGTLISNLTSR